MGGSCWEEAFKETVELLSLPDSTRDRSSVTDLVSLGLPRGRPSAGPEGSQGWVVRTPPARMSKQAGETPQAPMDGSRAPGIRLRPDGKERHCILLPSSGARAAAESQGAPRRTEGCVSGTPLPDRVSAAGQTGTATPGPAPWLWLLAVPSGSICESRKNLETLYRHQTRRCFQGTQDAVPRGAAFPVT